MAEPIDKFPEIHLHQNWLRVNDQSLWADVLKQGRDDKLEISATELERVLKLGRQAIVAGIEEIYSLTKIKNPTLTVERPSVFTAQLGMPRQSDGSNSRVFTQKGYANGGNILERDEIQDKFHPHWDAVIKAGFVPEVRRTSGVRDGGAWLLLRKPTFDDVLRHWLNYEEPVENSVIQQQAAEGRLNIAAIRAYRENGERAIETYTPTYDIARHDRQQIGLILAVGALKLSVDNWYGYRDEVEDALTYAENRKHINPSVALAIENAAYPDLDDETSA